MQHFWDIEKYLSMSSSIPHSLPPPFNQTDNPSHKALRQWLYRTAAAFLGCPQARNWQKKAIHYNNRDKLQAQLSFLKTFCTFLLVLCSFFCRWIHNSLFFFKLLSTNFVSVCKKKYSLPASIIQETVERILPRQKDREKSIFLGFPVSCASPAVK